MKVNIKLLYSILITNAVNSESFERMRYNRERESFRLAVLRRALLNKSVRRTFE